MPCRHLWSHDGSKYKRVLGALPLLPGRVDRSHLMLADVEHHEDGVADPHADAFGSCHYIGLTNAKRDSNSLASPDAEQDAGFDADTGSDAEPNASRNRLRNFV